MSKVIMCAAASCSIRLSCTMSNPDIDPNLASSCVWGTCSELDRHDDSICSKLNFKPAAKVELSKTARKRNALAKLRINLNRRSTRLGPTNRDQI